MSRRTLNNEIGAHFFSHGTEMLSRSDTAAEPPARHYEHISIDLGPGALPENAGERRSVVGLAIGQVLRSEERRQRSFFALWRRSSARR
jgi:hypothetical protein